MTETKNTIPSINMTDAVEIIALSAITFCWTAEVLAANAYRAYKGLAPAYDSTVTDWSIALEKKLHSLSIAAVPGDPKP